MKTGQTTRVATAIDSVAQTSAPRAGRSARTFRREPWRIAGTAWAGTGHASGWRRSGASSPGAPSWSVSILGNEPSPQAQRNAMGSRAYLIMNFTGGLLGLLCFAPLASWRGRRFAFAVYHVGAAIVAPLAFLGASTYTQASGSCRDGLFRAGHACRLCDLFSRSSSPRGSAPRGRASASTWAGCSGPLILIVRGTLGAVLGLRHAVVAMSGLFLVGLVILIFAPETQGQELPE